MEQLAYDLHIHSCLSPCAEEEMTPNNVVNMAYVKGLELIAVADHNCAKNLPACAAVAQERGLLFLPALEVESREEVHILCYFEEVAAALAFGETIDAHLPPIQNRPERFGDQLILNEEDEQTGTVSKLLIQATALSVDEIAALTRRWSGVPVPAHINRTSNSLIHNLGFIPARPGFTSVEVYRFSSTPKEDLSAYHVLFSSDAHRLEAISERENFLKLPERSVRAALDYLASAKG